MDSIERLECVYYSGPIPSSGAVLTVLCLVFDKIHFPNVYLPKGDYDKDLLRLEIQRLEALKPMTYDTAQLIAILNFLEYRLPLDGVLEFPSPSDSIFSHEDKKRAKLALAIHDLHFPPRPNFEPAIIPSYLKGLPESEESVIHAADFFYQAGAIIYASEKQLPLLDDGSSISLPFRAQYKDNAQSLATLLAIESVRMGLPDLPAFTLQELIDFRIENVKELRNFRASMLRYAKTLNTLISEDPSAEELARKAKFLIETEIHPALHDLNRDLLNPNRPWHKRMADGLKISSSVLLGFLTGSLAGQTAAEGIRSAILSELEAKGDKQEAAKRNGLYYLLAAERMGR